MIQAVSLVKNHFENVSKQNHLVFQPVYLYFKMFANGNKVTVWKLKGFSGESFRPLSTFDNSLNPGVTYIDIVKI